MKTEIFRSVSEPRHLLQALSGYSQYVVCDVSYGILLSVSLLGLSVCINLSMSAIISC